MVLEVMFETKHKIIPQGAVTYAVNCMGVCGNIIEEEKQFQVKLTGEEQKVFEVLRAIWEISFLYEGYFYKPIKYLYDLIERKVDELYVLNYYNIGKMWKDCATLLVDEKEYSEERILSYCSFRNKGRESKSMIKSLINAFYYLHSEAYEKINVNHRLCLFLNICDGYVINTSGPTNQVEANIKKVIGNLDVKLVKYGAGLLGIPKGKLYDALKNERHEIDHYAFRENSVMDYVFSSQDKKGDYMNLYFTYIVELALRVCFLSQFGVTCSKEKLEFATNEINDWVIFWCNLPEKCKNPKNVLKQELRELGIEM